MLFRIKLMIIICASVGRMEVWPDYSFFLNLISLKLSELQILIKWDRFFFGSEHVRSVSSGFQFLHALEHVRSLNNKWNKIDSTELTQSLVTQQSTIWRPQIRTKTNSWKKLEKYKNHNCMAWWLFNKCDRVVKTTVNNSSQRSWQNLNSRLHSKYRSCHLSATLPSCMPHPPNQFNLLIFFFYRKGPTLSYR